MNESNDMRPEARYGMPAADQIMFNRYYVTGFSYYFRQAKWALEIVSSNADDDCYVDRMNNFRSDLRIPQMFRAELKDYEGSGHDRGHLVCSANQRDATLQNSETFLLSNMSPQKPKLNRQKWRQLESAIRRLDSELNILETFVICGPLFDFDKPVKRIGADDGNDITIPIPHDYFKSVLTEDTKGKFKIYSFILPNIDGLDKSLDAYLVPTIEVEYKAGIFLWSDISGPGLTRQKTRAGKIWAGAI